MKRLIQGETLIICVAILLLMFFRGGYFLHSVFFFGVVLFISFGYKVYKSDEIRISRGPIGLGLLLLTLGYGVSCFVAIDTGSAVLGFIRMLIIYGLYQFFYQLELTEKELVEKSILLAGMTMSVFSLIGLVFDFGEQFLFQNQRLGGFFQYANTFAVFMLATVILAIKADNKKWLYGIPFCIACLYLSYSRSLIIMAGITCIGLIILKPKKAYHLIWLVPMGIILGMFISGCLDLTGGVQRLSGMSLQVSEWQTRLLYYEDGLKLTLQNPFGIGYLGYKYIQGSIQSGVYQVKFIHNGALQVLLDGGILALLGVCLSILACCYQILRNKAWIKGLLLGLLICHALIDFDLQFLGIWILVLMLFVDVREKEWSIKTVPKRGVLCGVAALLAFYFAIVTVTSYAGMYQFSYKLYPFYTPNTVALMQTYEKIDRKEDILEVAVNSLKTNAYIKYSNIYLRNYYLSKKEFDKALKYSEMLVRNYPLEMSHLENYVNILLFLVKSDIIEEDQKQKALMMMADLDGYIAHIQSKLSPRAYIIQHQPEVMLTERLNGFQEEARVLQSQRNK